MDNNLDAAIRKAGLVRGVIFGIILLLIHVGLIVFVAYHSPSPGVFFGVSFVFSYAVQFGLAIWLCSNLRKTIGGFWTLKQAITGIFFIFVTAYLISYLGILLFSNVIAPAVADHANQVTVETRRHALEMTHTPQVEIDKSISGMQRDIERGKQLNVGTIVQDVLISVILVFAISSIFGALYKRDKPTVEL